MKMPNSDAAFVARAKIKNYLLSEIHPVGRSKARFFRKFGFDDSNIDTLIAYLKKLAQTYEMVSVDKNLHGSKYTIDGELFTPKGEKITIRTIWIIEKNESKPRFVTAYPLSK